MKRILILGTPLLFWGCASQFAALQSGPSENQTAAIALQELRTEVADLTHALHATEVEFHLLEERMQEEVATKLARLEPELTHLRSKLAALESTQAKAVADLRSLAAHATSATTSLNQCHTEIQELHSRLEEVGKLKQVITSLARPKNLPTTPKSYKVKPGDSLEKIARAHKISCDALKSHNGLDSDRIQVGQSLEIPQ